MVLAAPTAASRAARSAAARGPGGRGQPVALGAPREPLGRPRGLLLEPGQRGRRRRGRGRARLERGGAPLGGRDRGREALGLARRARRRRARARRRPRRPTPPRLARIERRGRAGVAAHRGARARSTAGSGSAPSRRRPWRRGQRRARRSARPARAAAGASASASASARTGAARRAAPAGPRAASRPARLASHSARARGRLGVLGAALRPARRRPRAPSLGATGHRAPPRRPRRRSRRWPRRRRAARRASAVASPGAWSAPSGGVCAGDLRGPRDRVAHVAGRGAQRALGLVAAIAQPALDVGEAARRRTARRAARSRSSLRACRKRAKPPCGQQHDLAELLAAHAEQVAELRPRLLGAGGEHGLRPSSSIATTRTRWGSVVVPVAALLRPLVRRACGRSGSAARAASPPARPRSRVSGAAWSERSRAASCARAGDLAVEREADGVQQRVLPAPVRPCSRNSPASPSASKSTVSVPAKARKAGQLEPVQAHQPDAPRRRARPSARRAAAPAPPSPASAPRMSRDEAREQLLVVEPAQALGVGARGRDARRPAGSNASAPRAGSAGAGAPSRRRARRVGDRRLHPGRSCSASAGSPSSSSSVAAQDRRAGAGPGTGPARRRRSTSTTRDATCAGAASEKEKATGEPA